MIRPAEDLALYRAEMAQWTGPRRAARLAGVQPATGCGPTTPAAATSCAGSTRSGPLPSRELPDTCEVPWRSTGWTNNRNVTQLLELMVQRGEVAVAGRGGRDRLWDLADRVYPDDPVVPAEEALRLRNERRLRLAGHRPAARPGVPGRADGRRRRR